MNMEKYFPGCSNSGLISIEGTSEKPVIVENEALVYCAPNSSSVIKSTSGSISVYVDRNAKCVFAFMGKTGSCSMRFRVMEGSSLHLIGLYSGSMEADAEMVLGEGSRADVVSYFIGFENDNLSVCDRIVHSGKNAVSRLVTKGIVSGSSIVKCSGLVDVAIDAEGSDGFQDHNALLLSDDANMQFFPLLKIKNPNVKCSHDARMSCIDDTSLFYLQSRGIEKGEAKRIIVEGFLNIGSICNEDVRNEISDLIVKKIGAVQW